MALYGGLFVGEQSGFNLEQKKNLNLEKKVIWDTFDPQRQKNIKKQQREVRLLFMSCSQPVKVPC